jgi:hypothetical protein
MPSKAKKTVKKIAKKNEKIGKACSLSFDMVRF